MNIRKLVVSDKAFYKSVFILAVPIALQSMISIGVNMLDTIMLGNLGEMELSASSLANQFISIYHILCMGLGMGASVLVSRYWGMKKAGDQEAEASLALKRTVCIVLRLTLAIATLFAIATVAIPEWIMKTYTSEEPIIALGVVYFRYSVITYFFLGMSLVSTIILRSVGKVRIPLYVSIGAFFVNLGANYGLIYGKFGLPRMEIAGAALGTLIARVFETLVVCGYLLLVDQNIGFRFKDFFIKTGSLLWEYIRISIPVLVSDGILALGANSVTMVIGHLGVSFVAANAITSVVQQMSNVFTQGVSQAGAIVTGTTLGEGDQEKTMEQAYGFLGLGIGLGIFAAIVIMLISTPIIAAYNIPDATIQVTRQLMSAISFIMIFQSTNSIMTKGVLRGGGDTKMLMLTDNIFLWVFSIPLGLLAGFVFHWSAFLIYSCLKIDQIIKAVWCVYRLRSGKWIKKISTGNET